MANCSFCDDVVGMPYGCKLCGNKYCAKHRLPENHQCANIGHYKSKEYIKQKFLKEREVNQAKGIENTINTKPRRIGRQSSGFLNTLFSTWSGSNYENLAIASAIMVFIAFARVGIINFTFVFTVFILSSFAASFLFKVRRKVSNQNGNFTEFIIFKYISVLIVLLSFIGFSYSLFGRFIDNSNSVDGRSRVGKMTILSTIIIWLMCRILVLLIPSIRLFVITYGFLAIDNALWLVLTSAISVVGSIYLFYGVFFMIPFWDLDGVYILAKSTKDFIIFIIILIIPFLIDISL